jgi:hypothetical protein
MLGKGLLSVVALIAGITNAQDNDVPANERLDVVFGPRAIHAPGALMHPGRKSRIALSIPC